MPDATDLAAEGLGLNRKQRVLIIRVLWVLGVTSAIVYILGGLSFIGFISPLAKAADVKEIRTEMADLKQQVAISARLQLVQEIRLQKRVYCVNQNDDQIRQSTLRYLYTLVDELKKVDPNSQETPIPACPT